MKYIKSYRLFESRSSDILELLDLGLISSGDLPELIRDLDEHDQIKLVKPLINKYGFKETLRLFDNNVDIVKHAYQDNPSEFLEQFGNLTRVEKDDKIFYVDKDRFPLFYYYPEIGLVYINYYKIWSFFEDVIGLKYDEIMVIMNNWLEETYNLKGLTPDTGYTLHPFKLEETYNLKGLTP